MKGLEASTEQCHLVLLQEMIHLILFFFSFKCHTRNLYTKYSLPFFYAKTVEANVGPLHRKYISYDTGMDLTRGLKVIWNTTENISSISRNNLGPAGLLPIIFGMNANQKRRLCTWLRASG